jgi:uncharacterized protein (TIGR02996 family)
MNDRDALLNAIAEHPEEDVPRLMYADWLEENGEPERADFVRNQVELGRVGIDDPARRALVVKNVRYLNEFVPHWKDQLPQLPGVAWGDFNRGLIEEVQVDTNENAAFAATEIFAVPGVHVLRLNRLRHGRPLSKRPELVRLRALRLVAACTPSVFLSDLLASPYLGRLTALELDRTEADDTAATAIADGRFPDLTELYLGTTRVGDGGARALADSPHLPKLRLLDLRGNRITSPTVRAALVRRFGKAVKL